MELKELYKTIKDRIEKKPEGSYIRKLAEDGLDRMIQKVGEEAVEVVIAAKNKEKNRLISESADLLFHLFILLSIRKITLTDIEKELSLRRRK
ncbi:MAG: phosphoribosyl-ATP diphosphatase [Microgenomates group bacterium]